MYMNIISIYYTDSLLRERAKYFHFSENSFDVCIFCMSVLFDQHTCGEHRLSRMPFLLFFFLGFLFDFIYLFVLWVFFSFFFRI